MASYIEFDKNPIQPAASTEARIVLGVNIDGEITTTDHTGTTSPLAGILNITYNQLIASIAASTLKPGALYKITGVDSDLYGGTDILIKAATNNTLELTGHGIFYNPKYINSQATPNNGYGIWSNYITLEMSNIVGTFNQGNTVVADNSATATYLANGFLEWISGDWSTAISIDNGQGATADVSGGVSPSYAIGEDVIWGGKHWTNTSGNVGTQENKYTLSSADWTVVPFNSTDYNVVADVIHYDYTHDMIIRRKDKWNNDVDGNFQIFTEFAEPDGYDYGNPIKDFQWGNGPEDFNTNDYYYIGVQSNYVKDSYLECINFIGSYLWFNTLTQQSYMWNNKSSTNSQINNNTLTNSYFNYNTLTNSYINSNTLTSSYIYSNTLTSSYINSNTLTSSYIYSNTLNANSSINSNTLTNSQISGNTLTSSNIYSNTLTSSNINSNTLTNSNIYSNTLTNSYFNYNTLTNSQISGNTLTNSQISGNTLTSSNIYSNTLTNSSISGNTLTNSQIYSNTLTANSSISGNTLTNSQINNNTLTSSYIYSNTLTANSSISGNTLTNSYINSNTLTNSQINNNTLTSSYIYSNTLTSGQIYSNTLISSGFDFSTSVPTERTIRFIEANNSNATIDLEGATIIFENYSKKMFKNSEGVIRLGYYDGTDVFTVVNVNS